MKIQCKGGRGKAKNPHGDIEPRSDWTRGYAAIMAGAEEQREIQNMQQTYWIWKDFDRAHPELPCFLPNGDKFMGEGEYPGEPKQVWQHKETEQISDDMTKLPRGMVSVQKVYIIHPQQEQKPDLQASCYWQDVINGLAKKPEGAEQGVEELISDATRYMMAVDPWYGDEEESFFDGVRFGAKWQLTQSTREREALYTEDEKFNNSIKNALVKANQLIRLKDERIRKMESGIQWIIENKDHISEHMMKSLLADILTVKS